MPASVDPAHAGTTAPPRTRRQNGPPVGMRRIRLDPGPLPHQHHVDAPEQVDLLSDALLSQLAYEERELVEPLARLGLG